MNKKITGANTLYISWRFQSQSFKLMANKLVYSWADKLWQMSPPRKYIATRWQQSHRSESQQFRNVKEIWLTNLDYRNQPRF